MASSVDLSPNQQTWDGLAEELGLGLKNSNNYFLFFSCLL